MSQPGAYQPNVPRDRRRRRRYNDHEMAAINPFKDQYLCAETIADRKQIYKANILPAMLTYWRQAGTLPTKEEEVDAAIKVLFGDISVLPQKLNGY